MGSINFCSSCGYKLEGSPKFCPECGNSLTKEVSSGFSFSPFGGGISKIASKTASIVSGATDSIKKSIDKKEEASRKTVNVTSLRYEDGMPEQTIGSLWALVGNGVTKRDARIIFTSKSLLAYVRGSYIMNRLAQKSVLGKLATKNKEEILYFKIDLKDIKQISRIQSPISQEFSYEIVTAKETFSINTKAEPYTFSLYISMVLNFDTSLFNIELMDDEHVENVTAATVDFGEGKKYGTIYITNKRVCFTKLVNTKIINKSNRMMMEEGTELVFSIDKDRLKDIAAESKGFTNCEYIIKYDRRHYVVQFAKIVPKAFWSLIPCATGNKDLLERKKKIMKGVKVGLLAASFLGVAGDADASDVDVDSPEFDFDGDGDIDAIGFDSDGDGVLDSLAYDTDEDGLMDTFAMDSDGDGMVDDLAYDSNGDGVIDTVEMDTNGDGIMDAKSVDTNGDGSFDTFVKDSNGDGAIDSFASDMDGDGQLDTFSMDTNNDGIFDTTATDANGDGMIDKVAFDTNGDGRFDAIKMDTNNDGILDTTGIDVNYDGSLDGMYRN